MVHYFKPAWFSTDETLEACAGDLEQQLISTSYTRAPNKNFASAFNVILTTLAGLGGFNGSLIAISTNYNLYTGSTRRNPAYTAEMYKCLKWLIERGYLVKESGMKVIPSRNSQDKTPQKPSQGLTEAI